VLWELRISHEQAAEMQQWVPANQTSCECLQELPLNGFDNEAREFVLEQYKLRGIKYHGLSSPSKITKGSDGKLTVTVDLYEREGDTFNIEGVDEVGHLKYCLQYFKRLPVCCERGALQDPGCSHSKRSMQSRGACSGPVCNWKETKDRGHWLGGGWCKAE